MICKIEGKILENSTRKDKDGNVIPVGIVYSGKELVEIRGFQVDEKLLGSRCLVVCEVKLRVFEGRSFLSVNKLED